jgi:hypothetical protein
MFLHSFVAWSDVTIGVQDDRIFIVNRRSEVRLGKQQGFFGSYRDVISDIDTHFPLLPNSKN